MDDTYRTRAVVLKREPYREDDSLVTVYSEERGKLTLLARGTKKIRSKLAAHLEPFCLLEAMVVRGRGFDYLGSAASVDCFARIKSDYEKTAAAGSAIRTFNGLIKEGEGDRKIFELLNEFLTGLAEQRAENAGLISAAFLLKFLVLLGYAPELYCCAICKKKIEPGGNSFSFSAQSVVCRDCNANGPSVAADDETVKLLRLMIEQDFPTLDKVSAAPVSRQAAQTLVSRLVDYQQ